MTLIADGAWKGCSHRTKIGKRWLKEAGEVEDAWIAERIEDNVANAAAVELQEIPRKEPEVSKTEAACSDDGSPQILDTTEVLKTQIRRSERPFSGKVSVYP